MSNGMTWPIVQHGHTTISQISPEKITYKNENQSHN